MVDWCYGVPYTLAVLHSHSVTHQQGMEKEVCSKQSKGTSKIFLQYIFHFEYKPARLNHLVN